MNNEVEEFLRRAAQRRAQVEAQLRAQAEARARGTAPQPPSPRNEPPKRLTPATQSISQQQGPVQAEIVELAGTGDRVSASVAEHMRQSQDIAAHVELLGDRVEIADDEMNAHLHQVFDHSVGRLRKTTERTPAADQSAGPSEVTTVIRDASPAHGIAELLRSLQSVRNAFILAEVLNRPADRW